MKFIKIFLSVLIIVGIGLLVAQKMSAPKDVATILKSENKEQLANPIPENKNQPTSSETYADIQNGFEFTHPSDEQVEVLTDSSIPEDNTGKKIITVQIIYSKDGFTCIDGQDVRCKNIVAGDHNAIVQYSMSGNINAHVDLLNGKSVFLSLSCDSTSSGMKLQNDYCVISEQRQKMFDNLLSTFKFSK